MGGGRGIGGDTEVVVQVAEGEVVKAVVEVVTLIRS